MNKIFLRFTIKGDDLNVFDMLNDISVKADVYEKGRIYSNAFGGKSSPQSTNRWVYSLESRQNESLNCMLKRMYKDLRPSLERLVTYTKKYYSLLDIVIYVDDCEQKSMFNVNFSKEGLKIISKLNSKTSLTFVDF